MLKEKPYRIIHAIIDNPKNKAKLIDKYALHLNSCKYSSRFQSTSIFDRIQTNQAKPYRRTLEKIAMCVKEIFNDPRSIDEIIGWLMLPYDYNLFSSYIPSD